MTKWVIQSEDMRVFTCDAKDKDSLKTMIDYLKTERVKFEVYEPGRKHKTIYEPLEYYQKTKEYES